MRFSVAADADPVAVHRASRQEPAWEVTPTGPESAMEVVAEKQLAEQISQFNNERLLQVQGMQLPILTLSQRMWHVQTATAETKRQKMVVEEQRVGAWLASFDQDHASMEACVTISFSWNYPDSLSRHTGNPLNLHSRTFLTLILSPYLSLPCTYPIQL